MSLRRSFANSVRFHCTYKSLFLLSIGNQFRKNGISNRVDDNSSSIGKRYARNDEVGTPFAVTIDFQTAQDSTVTLRERDSTKQIREKLETVVQIVSDLVEERTTWSDVLRTYPEFTQQEV